MLNRDAGSVDPAYIILAKAACPHAASCSTPLQSTNNFGCSLGITKSHFAIDSANCICENVSDSNTTVPESPTFFGGGPFRTALNLP